MELEKQVTIKKLTHEEVVNFLSGVNSYSSYWCSHWEAESDFEYRNAKQRLTQRMSEDEICFEDVMAEVLLSGHSIILADEEEGEEYTLTIENLKQAIGKALEDETVSQHLVEDWDCEDCDSILQIALFGEVIYG